MASECGGLTSDAVPGAPRKTPVLHELIENDVKKCETNNENKDTKANTVTLESVSKPIENSRRTEQTNAKQSKEKKSQPKNTKRK